MSVKVGCILAWPLEAVKAPARTLPHVEPLKQTTQDAYTAPVTLSAAKGLSSQMLRSAQHDSVPMSRGPI
jgi:hypothetical protein